MARLKSFEVSFEFEMHLDDVCNGWLNHTKIDEWLKDSSDGSKTFEIIEWLQEEGYDYKLEFASACGVYLQFELLYEENSGSHEVPDDFLAEFTDYSYYVEEDEDDA